MHRLFTSVIRPLLEAMAPQAVVEVGAAEGAHTRLLADFCREHGAILHSIDPLPRFDPAELDDGSATLVFHREDSLSALPSVGAVDVALLDGDHNWFTVNRELGLLQASAQGADQALPLIVCHDVCWPYARRDLYYDPEAIPPEHRHPWRRAGIVPGHSELVAGGGLNAHLCNAVHEGGPRNGVMTAIDDFVAGAGEPLTVMVLPIFYGLAILVSAERLARHPELEPELERWTMTDGCRELLELTEHHRRQGDARNQVLRRSLDRPAAGAQPERPPPRRAIAAAGRTFASGMPAAALAGVQAGVLRTTYRGVPFLKSPFDVVLYLDLFERLRPATVIEVGTKAGGSALWFADTQDAHGIAGRVLSVDLDNPPALRDDRIAFIRGDAARLADALPEATMAALPRPLLVVEDSAHRFETTLAALEFFHGHLESGDYIVIEDGIVADLPGDRYATYEDGPNRALKAFLERHPDDYAIDEALCDRYGHNVTWCPNGWLRRL